MSETQSATREPTHDFYLPATIARPTFGRVEQFLKQHLGRYGVVRLPYDVLPR